MRRFIAAIVTAAALIAPAAASAHTPAAIDGYKARIDSISELNQQDMLLLQQLMEKKGQLESMISNVMKATADQQSAIASNLKAS